MLQRCVRELSLGRSLRRQRIAAQKQMSYLLSSRNEFSSAVHRNASQKPSPEKPATESSQSGMSKLVVGSLVVGAALMAAYQSGYIDQLQSKNEKSSIGSNKLDNVETLEEDDSDNQVALPSNEKMLVSNENTAEKNELHQVKDSEVHKEGISKTSFLEEKPLHAKDNELATLPDETALPPAKQSSDSEVLSEGCINTDTKIDHIELCGERVGAQTSTIQNEGINVPIHVSEDTVRKEDAHHDDSSMEIPKDSLNNESEARKSLAQTYGLEEAEGSPAVPGKTESTDVASMLKNEEVSSAASKVSMDNSGSGRVLVDLIEAIHAAETKQAESDAYIFAEEKRKLKEKYEKEIKDARARQLMYAEEAAILDKELNKEKAKAAATIKLLQEKAEQKLLEELKHKEEEADKELKKAQELSKAELAAAIASEKAAQIEKIAEANLHINALCMAFYARSEEARQSHSVHKLALGTLALEDALSKGLPIRSEVNALRMSLEGIDRDSLLDLALSSLPDETLKHGTNTQMQLNQKFDSLKGILRHFSLIPAGGGGLLAHAIARVASLIKMREDEYGDGVESLISRVEKLVVEGRLADAADALEVGVRGTEAAGVVVEWVTQARNRAVAEQLLSILQSYATSITFS